nr:hypothetical protein [Micromonospora chalcea]
MAEPLWKAVRDDAWRPTFGALFACWLAAGMAGFESFALAVALDTSDYCRRGYSCHRRLPLGRPFTGIRSSPPCEGVQLIRSAFGGIDQAPPESIAAPLLVDGQGDEASPPANS